MNDIDQTIQEAFRGVEGSDALVREPGIWEELIDTLRGRHRWLHAIAIALSFAFAAIAFWAGFRFYAAVTPHDQLQWGGLCLLALLFVSFIKVYFWLAMHTNRILRELKRVELLVLLREKSERDQP